VVIAQAAVVVAVEKLLTLYLLVPMTATLEIRMRVVLSRPPLVGVHHTQLLPQPFQKDSKMMMVVIICIRKRILGSKM
jgi:hypothetical protein